MSERLLPTRADVQIEVYSTIAITIAWLVGAALAGALGPQWLDAHAGAPPLSRWLAACSAPGRWRRPWPLSARRSPWLPSSCPWAAPAPLDAGTAVADLDGMLAAVVLWRSAILTSW